jgi:hypothetical protein
MPGGSMGIGRPGKAPALRRTDFIIVGWPDCRRLFFSTSYPELRNFWDATITLGIVRQCRQIFSPKPLLSRTARIFRQQN